jgi:hypothetical protein
VIRLAILAIACAACSPAPSASPDPAALPLDYAIVWDLPGSTDQGGAGPYFDTPSSNRLRAGPVLVAWWCAGSGILAVAPGRVGGAPEMPSPESPLAFQVACPTSGSGYVGWRRLGVEAVGGENALSIRNVGSAAAISYRLLFAQPSP